MEVRKENGMERRMGLGRLVVSLAGKRTIQLPTAMA